jgi:predicted MFS family arabinose efflux permease
VATADAMLCPETDFAAPLKDALVLYGTATVVGNFACGRWVDLHGAWRVQRIGPCGGQCGVAVVCYGSR